MLVVISKKELLDSGVKPNQIISINFEDLEYEALQEYHALHEYIVERLIPNTPVYVFLDEVQHVPQFEKVVGSLFIKPNVDIYITGSNAYFMSSDIATLLTGRYVQIEMLPLSFKEFHSAYSQQNLSDMDIYNLYIEHSSFPRLVRVEDDESIDEYLESILNTVVLKDIVTRRELSPLEQLDDNYPKYLLTMDVLHKTDNHNGIEQKNVLDWLLE